MKISPALAQKIVDNLKMTLNQQVNFMNIDGIIIASTNQDRLNTLHEGAVKVLKTKKSLFIEYDVQFTGAKKGINMPIYFDHEIIGVIGLTGEREVEKYAQILKAMTEILVKEAYLNEISFQTREKNRLIIESMLINPQDSFEESLLALDFSAPYRVVVGALGTSDANISQLFSLLEASLAHDHQSFFTLTPRLIILLIPQRGIDARLKAIQQEVLKRYQLKLNFGVGMISHKNEDLKKSFETAKQALKWIQVQEQKISYFEDLDLEILLSNVPEENKDFFVSKVLNFIPPQELDYFHLILKTFSKHNGSIQKSANELFIHKNTLQYQLNKLKKLTGYDPRNYYDFSVLYLAFLLMDL